MGQEYQYSLIPDMALAIIMMAVALVVRDNLKKLKEI
jgi:hypothetical protein